MTHKRRAYPRHHYEAPIKYSKVKTDEYTDSKMFNYSRGGIFFKSEYPLKPRTDIGIVMPGYTPGSYGPESFKFYVAQIKWCKAMDNGGCGRYGIGAEFLSRSHGIRGLQEKDVLFTCDLCGKLVPFEQLHQMETSVSLCPACFKHFSSIPDCDLRGIIDRFLSGNVV